MNNAEVISNDNRRAGNMLATGCLFSVMAIVWATIGFVVGFLVRGI